MADKHCAGSKRKASELITALQKRLADTRIRIEGPWKTQAPLFPPAFAEPAEPEAEDPVEVVDDGPAPAPVEKPAVYMPQVRALPAAPGVLAPPRALSDASALQETNPQQQKGRGLTIKYVKVPAPRRATVTRP
jgi:hypothetical protein